MKDQIRSITKSNRTLNDAFLGGNELLRERHKKLLEICDRVFRFRASPYFPPPNFDAILGEYTKAQLEYFAAEEEVLRRNGYPGLAKKLAEHNEIRAKLAGLLSRAAAGELYMKALLKLIGSSAAIN